MSLQRQSTFPENGFQAIPANADFQQNGNPLSNSGLPGHFSLKNILTPPKVSGDDSGGRSASVRSSETNLTASRQSPTFNKKTNPAKQEQRRLDPIPVIDRLSVIVPGSVSAPGVEKRFQRLLDLGGIISNGYSKNYDNNYQMYGEINLQWGAKQGKEDSLRIEWNPANTGVKHIADIVTCFPAHKLRHVRISRNDIAIDYPVHIIPAMFDKPGIKKGGFYGKNGIDTLYLGSDKSELQIRVYDKKLQLQETAGIEIDLEHLFRIEAQCRYKKEPLIVDLSGGATINLPRNPFEGLVYYQPKEGLSNAEWACVVSGCKEHGVIGIRKLCQPKEWVRKHLKQLQQTPTIDPASTFDRYGSGVFRDYFKELSSHIDALLHADGRLAE